MTNRYDYMPTASQQVRDVSLLLQLRQQPHHRGVSRFGCPAVAVAVSGANNVFHVANVAYRELT